MNSSRILIAVAALVLVILSVSPVNAGSMGNGAAQRQRLVVDSVDATGGTIVLKSMADNSIHTYKIVAATQIFVGRAKGSMDQIQAGQKVVNFRPVGGPAPQTLNMLMVAQAAAEPPAPANK